MNTRIRAFSIAAAACMGAWQAQGAPPTYSVTEILPPDVFPRIAARDVNDAGVVTGDQITPESIQRAFRLRNDGVFKIIGPLDNYSNAYSINSSRHIAGALFEEPAMFTGRDIIILPHPAASICAVRSIAENDWMAGNCFSPTGPVEAIPSVWQPTGPNKWKHINPTKAIYKVANFANDPDASSPFPFVADINSKGAAVGILTWLTHGQEFHRVPYIWRAQTGKATRIAGAFDALRINTWGEVLVQLSREFYPGPRQVRKWALWKSGTLAYLASDLDDYSEVDMADLSDSGQAVGHFQSGPLSPEVAALFENGTTYKLQDLVDPSDSHFGMSFKSAVAISPSGVILAINVEPGTNPGMSTVYHYLFRPKT